MRGIVLFAAVLVFSGSAFADDIEADSLIREEVQLFMEALQTGDGETASALFSSAALGQVDAMLNTIKQSLDRDPEGTLRRLSSAGYQVDEEKAEDWRVEEYLAETLSLPMISARYTPYELEIDTVTIDGRSAVVEMIFRTASGNEIPQQAIMAFEDDIWKVSSFMGITAFP